MLGYYKLCRHYKFALDSIFELYPESHGVIIVEGKLPILKIEFCYIRIRLFNTILCQSYFMIGTVCVDHFYWYDSEFL